MSKSGQSKGDKFRDYVADFLKAAGYFNVQTEVQIGGKNVDIYGEIGQGFRHEKLAIETKNFDGTLPLGEVTEFVADYSSLTQTGAIDKALLVSKGEFTPQGKSSLSNATPNSLYGYTLHEFQRTVFGPYQLIRSSIDAYDREELAAYYVETRSEEGPLISEVESWIASESKKPLVVLGGYGSGKWTCHVLVPPQVLV